MNDRFKFRVWDKKEKRYINFEQFKKGDIEFNFNPQTNEIWIEYDKSRYIVEQCTGIKDKNGKLIYEGNIVVAFFYNGEDIDAEKGRIYWNEKGGYPTILVDTNIEIPLYISEIEIIGNIHENHELLEKK